MPRYGVANTALLTEGASTLPGLCVLQTGEGQLYEEGLLPEGKLSCLLPTVR